MSVQSYLDSTFSSYEDLETKVDTESARLKSEETELSSQLEVERERNQRDAKEGVNELKSYFLKLNNDRVGDELDDGHELPKLLESKALPSDIALKLNGVKSLLHAKDVIKRLQEFERLSKELEKVLQEENGVDSARALELYDDLADIAVELVTKAGVGVTGGRSTAENPLHDAKVIKRLIIKSIDYVNNNILEKVREKSRQRLAQCLEKNDWPDQKAFNGANPSAVIEFQELLLNGLKTERKIKIKRSKGGTNLPESSTPSPPTSLSIFDLLTNAEEIRFKFHFETDKPTNRIDKPEWMFNFIVNTVDNHNDFLMKVVQPILVSVNRYKDRISVHEFIISLLPFVYRKLRTIMKELTNVIKDDEVTDESYILSHLVHEIISFDNLLKSKYYFTPYENPHWRGITGDTLSTDNFFNKWLLTEKNIALKRYQEIIDTPDGWEIAWEETDDSNEEISITKPTISAMSIKDLFEGVTEHYSSLRSVRYRLRFLLDIQIHILDRYYNRLAESISAFESMSSSLSRAVGGVSAEDRKLVVGVKGLERLCRIYGSLSYIISALEEWGEDLFFLELWEDVSKLYNKTGKEDDNESTLFDETIGSYLEKKQKVGAGITNHLRRELRNALQECYMYSDWTAESENTSITPKLVRPIQSISQLLTFLRRFQSANDYGRSSRNFASELSKYLWDNIIQANRFSVGGSMQLLRDIGEMWTIWLLPRDASLTRLEEACVVLSAEESSKNLSDEAIREFQEKLELSALSVRDIRSLLPRRKN